MTWKVTVTARAALIGEECAVDLEAADCEVEVVSETGPFSASQMKRILDGKDAVLAGADNFSREVLAAEESKDLKIVSRWGVGYDSVDLAAATEKGIVVAYTPGLLDDAVGEYAFTLMLTLSHHVHEAHQSLCKGEWKVRWGNQVRGKIMGIVGYGRIGRAMARCAEAMGMSILAYDIQEISDKESPQVEQLGFDELLERSDYVSLHAAMTPDNKGMINAEALQRMKPTAYLINTARGGFVDETALIEALNSGSIAGAALDTFEQEPLPKGHPLTRTPHLLITPHQAFAGLESGVEVGKASAQAILDLMHGKRPQLPLNPEVYSASQLRAELSEGC
jgi:phosphoglycerate dehydrogenase-like enzyme